MPVQNSMSILKPEVGLWAFLHMRSEKLRIILLFHENAHRMSGFTRRRSTLGAILSLCLLSEICREYRRPLRVAYVDFKAAFDFVDRAALWKLEGIIWR